MSRLKTALLAVVTLSCGTTGKPPAVSPAAKPEAAPRVATPQTTGGPTELDQWRARCDKGDPTACNNLAFLIEKKDPDAATRLYAMACDQDVPSACHNIGFMIHSEGDLEHAVPYFVKACGLSHVPACETLRSMMNAQEKSTGNISCLEIPMKGGKVGHVCSNLSGSGDWDELMEELRRPQ